MTTLNSPRSRLHWIAFASFVAVAVLLRVFAFQGYSDSDPRDYTILANDMAHGILHFQAYDGPPVFPLRLGVYGPTALLIKVFGLSEITLALYPFLVSIAGCLLAYALARDLWGPLAGLIGMGLWAVLPIDISMASRLYPDAIAAFWANVGVAFAYLALTRSRSSPLVGYAELSGLFFGVSWLCKETVIYLIPFVVIFILFLSQQKSLKVRIISLASIGFSSIVVLSVEMLFFQKIAGDTFFHLHTTERNYEYGAAWFFDSSSSYFGWQSGDYAKALVKRLFQEGPKQIVKSFNALPAFAALAAAWAVVLRHRSFAVLGIWLVTLLVMFNFMTTSFQSYKPLPIVERHLYPILLPASLLVAGFITMLLTSIHNSIIRRERKFWACVLVMIYCSFNISSIQGLLKSRPQQIERIVASKLTEPDVVYTDYRSASSLVFFRTSLLLPYTSTTIPYENVALQDMKKGSYVLIDTNMNDFMTSNYKYQSPPFVESPPETWKKVWADMNAVLYQVTEPGFAVP